AADLVEGANTVVVCLRDAAGNTGSRTLAITRDTIAPTVTAASAAPAAIAAGAASTVTLAASHDGHASLRLGDCAGTVLASGAYTAPPYTTLFRSAADLVEGANTVVVCLRDAAGNTGSRTLAITKDTIAPTITAASAAPTAIGT